MYHRVDNSHVSYCMLSEFIYVLVINSLLLLIHEPEPDHALRADIAEEFKKDKKKFIKNAEEFSKKHGEPRQ